jgi:hypothetical protein
MVRQYAGIVGAVLLLIGVVGLLAGEGHLGGQLNIDMIEDIIHILTGTLLAYAGFGQRDAGLARTIVGVLGAVYLLVGILGFVSANLFGIIPSGYTIIDNIIHLALGVLNLAVAYVLDRPAVTTT